MARPTTANACNVQLQATIGGQVQTVTCGRGEGHPNAHQGKVSWAPRWSTAAPRSNTRIVREAWPSTMGGLWGHPASFPVNTRRLIHKWKADAALPASLTL